MKPDQFVWCTQWVDSGSVKWCSIHISFVSPRGVVKTDSVTLSEILKASPLLHMEFLSFTKQKLLLVIDRVNCLCSVWNCHNVDGLNRSSFQPCRLMSTEVFKHAPGHLTLAHMGIRHDAVKPTGVSFNQEGVAGFYTISFTLKLSFLVH